MRGIEWGRLYESYHKKAYDPQKILSEVKILYGDPYVKNKKGIFEYILGGAINTRFLNIRVFDEAIKRSIYANQTNEAKEQNKSNCPLCVVGNDANKNKILKIVKCCAELTTM